MLKKILLVPLFSILTCISACKSQEVVIVQRCHDLPDPTWKTVKELYRDDVFVRAYLKECTKEKK